MSYQNQENKGRLAIVIGPAGPADLKLKVEQWAANSNKSSDDIWIELVSEQMEQMTNRGLDSEPSSIDELFSNLLNQNVKVGNPFQSFSSRGGQMVPSFVFSANSIVGSSGRSIEIEEFTQEVRDAIGNALGYILKSEWVHISILF